MENVENAIGILRKRNILQDQKFAEMRARQTDEYDDLMNRLQTLKDERISHMEGLSKNLRTLTAHEHSIYKLVHSSENVPGLPISHSCHRQATALFSEGIEFINNVTDVSKNLINQDNVNPIGLVNNMATCTEAVGKEMCKIKSAIVQVEALRKSLHVMQDHFFAAEDEDMEA